MKKIDWWLLITMIVIAEAAGLIGSYLAGNMGVTYMGLVKPPLAPPGLVFGIVWPILYLLMGIASYLIIESDASSKKIDTAMTLYWMQLFVNILWPFVFSRLELYWVAVIVLVILVILVGLTIVSFYGINKTAAYLLLPYLLWLFFATYLNVGFALLN